MNFSYMNPSTILQQFYFEFTPPFPTSLVSSLKYPARVSNSRADSFFSPGWYQIGYCHLAWLVNVDRITA